MYFLILCSMLIFSCVPTKKISKGDSIVVKEAAVKAETVYVPTVQTVVETVTVIKETMPGVFKIQIGAFKEKSHADRIYNSLRKVYGDLIYVENIPPYWKIRIGHYVNREEAVKKRDELKNQGFVDAFITK